MATDREPSLELYRERTIQALCSHFAHDRLTTEQVDERLEHAQKAHSRAELELLLADLPQTEATALIPEPRPRAPIAPSDDDEEFEQKVTAIMGEVKRTGVWTPPRRLRVRSIMGSVIIDLRDARLLPGLTEISVFAFMAEVKVLVPPGVRVVSDGTAIMAAFGGDSIGGYSDDPNTPIVRVTGTAIWAEVRARIRVSRRRLEAG
jgi:hypothetical protein